MAKTLALASDGSKPLENNLHERYARLRAAALPRIVAFRKAGSTAKNDHVADANSFRLERKPGVRARIEFLARQAQERIAEKRVALEEQLWAVLEADMGAFWETYETAKTSKDGELETDQEGKMLTVRKQRAKLINDLPPEFRKLIEDVTIDRNGNVVPKLYSKAQANRGLREMLNIGGHKEQEADDVSKLSDAELIQQLSDQAKQLGVDINLNYSFLNKSPEAIQVAKAGQVVDIGRKAKLKHRNGEHRGSAKRRSWIRFNCFNRMLYAVADVDSGIYKDIGVNWLTLYDYFCRVVFVSPNHT